MNKYINLLKKIIILDISYYFSHKQSTFFHFFADFAEFFLQPLIIYFIYTVSMGFEGWSMHEMFFLIATSRISLSLAGSSVIGIIFSNAWKLESGDFHQVLLKPFNTILYMIATSVNFNWVMDLTVGLILLVYSMAKLNFALTLFSFLSYIYLLFISLLCYYGVAGLIMNFLFKNPRAHNIMDLFWTATGFSKYPLNIFPNYLKFILTFVLPISLSSYYPATYFLNKTSDYSALIIFSLIGIIFAFIGTLALKDGLKSHISYGG